MQNVCNVQQALIAIPPPAQSFLPSVLPGTSVPQAARPSKIVQLAIIALMNHLLKRLVLQATTAPMLICLK